MIDVEVLRDAGLTEIQINAVLRVEAARKLKLDAERARRYRASRKSRDYRDASRISRDAGEIPKQNQSNGHDRHVTHDSETLIFSSESSSSRQSQTKDSQKSSRKNRDGFELFYTAYPKHVAKMAAEKAYAKALQRATHAEIMAGLQRQKPNFPERKFIPHPATWLNAGRWLDEAEPSRWLNGIEGVM